MKASTNDTSTRRNVREPILQRLVLRAVSIGLGLALSALSAGVPAVVQAQTPPETASALQRNQLSGPRVGFTAFTGDVSDRRSAAGLEPIMTQFGWQFETQIVSTNGGAQALLEWVPLVGGVEQGELNLSLAWLAGIRSSTGLEIGAGPNMSWNKDSDDITTSMQVAGGASIPVGDFYVPLNLSVGIAEGGPRFTVLAGWIVGS